MARVFHINGSSGTDYFWCTQMTNLIAITCAVLSICGFVTYVAGNKALGISLVLISVAIYIGLRVVR